MKSTESWCVFCSITVHLVPGEEDFSLDLVLGYQPNSSRGLPVFAPHSTDITGVYCYNHAKIFTSI